MPTPAAPTLPSNDSLIKMYQDKLAAYIKSHAGKEGHNPYLYVQTKFAAIDKAIKSKVAFTPDEIKLIQSDWEAPAVNTIVDSAKAILADTKLKQPLPGR